MLGYGGSEGLRPATGSPLLKRRGERGCTGELAKTLRVEYGAIILGVTTRGRVEVGAEAEDN
jgi:hypothetical protein